ncbi:Prephenate dehydratase-domain-containing protein [Aspergillus pseudotamarii]|uniref:prephenate dehydratase n=1 Tax=Aspergillus pseudotamarii TaxID=132259 RepID=A0A5N6SER7_ASPPS|nr:Prephenate dehydratase-domain-containing protein [Aspergillus pseudotamarii]KAE8132200.1 Prephenate dehydratase-domain-containing protein [Aspergillus pseudotamarii]
MEHITVTFLGPAASFSHQAAVEFFGKSAELLPCVSFTDAFTAVQQGEADYAIIPCENSTNGSVVQTLDLLADPNDLYKDVEVCGVHYLTVHHCLLARRGVFSSQQDYGSVAKLYTHPQAWGQCERFLGKYFKGIERQDVSSTSKAGEIVSKAKTEQSAAIASRFAAEFHGLDVLEENIEDKTDNTTRFLVLRNKNSGRTGPRPFGDLNNRRMQGASASTARKTLISFMVCQYAPGALAEALLIFKRHGMNLTSINSRPSQKKNWQYVFLVECQIANNLEDKGVGIEILGHLQSVTETCRHLGTWSE